MFSYKGIELFKININFAKFRNPDTATDIDADQIRDNLISEISGKTYNTAFSGVNIRHNTNLTILKGILRQKSVDLALCLIFNVICEYL